jgi:hypothetical protein
MKYKNIIQQFALIKISATVVLTGVCINTIAQNNQNFVQLRDGVIISKARNEVYITTPESKVQALDFNGQTLWTGTAAATPVAIFNTKLICLSKASSPVNGIDIIELDISRKGNRLNAYKALLPVDKNKQDDASAVFKIVPKVFQNNLYVTWQHTSFPLRGIYEADSTSENKLPVSDSGAFRLDKAAGKLRTMKKNQVPVALYQQKAIAPDAFINTKNKYGQFFSADKQHTLTSTRIAGDSVFEHYQWEIFEAATNKKIGQLRDYRSFAPFYVSGNMIVYEKGPYAVAVKDDIQQAPLELVAVDITNGQTLWKKQIFDDLFMEQVPPEKPN